MILRACFEIDLRCRKLVVDLARAHYKWALDLAAGS